MKTIRIAQKEDWRHFLAVAKAEGWRVPQLECQLFQGKWLPQTRILEDKETFCGLVTAVAHKRSGWIGNLIVPQDLRGRGYGSLLFTTALKALEGQGVDSVWLTASKMGQPLYDKHGFVKVDGIERWVSHKRQPLESDTHSDADSETLLRKGDRNAWGEERTALLDAVIEQGQAFVCDDTVTLLQQEPGMQVIGPWYSPSQCPRANRLVLQNVMVAAAPNTEIVVDALASSPVRQLLAAAGFVCAGKNALMVKGEAAEVDLSMMVSLASLGSVG